MTNEDDGFCYIGNDRFDGVDLLNAVTDERDAAIDQCKRLREENERLRAVVDAAIAWYNDDTRAEDDFPLMDAVQAYLDGKELENV